MPKGAWREFHDPSKTTNDSKSQRKQAKNLQPIRIQKTKGGKNGKTVTVITGFDLNEQELKKLLKQIKSQAGTGGTIKKDCLELQGDQISLALKFLEQQGFKPKQSGGR